MPGSAVLDSARIVPSRLPLLRLEYLEIGPSSIPEDRYAEHHVLLCLSDSPRTLECVRDGERQAFALQRGDVMLTPAGMSTGWRWSEAVSAIVILIEPDDLARFARAEIGLELTDEQLRSVPKFSDPDLLGLAEGMRGALETAKKGTPGSSVLFEALARAFIVQLVQRYGTANPEEREGVNGGKGDAIGVAGLTPERYRRVLDYIAECYGERIALDDLASLVAVSPSYFTRLFRERSGLPPMQFVTAFRIERAKEQLADRDRPMIGIALSCGFADQAHFSRTFKRVVGLTPKAFRAGLASEARGSPAQSNVDRIGDEETINAVPRDALLGARAAAPLPIADRSQQRNEGAAPVGTGGASPDGISTDATQIPNAERSTGPAGAPVRPAATDGSIGPADLVVPLERED